MGVGGKYCLLLLLMVATALSQQDTEVVVCELKCEDVQGYQPEDKLKCKERCQKYEGGGGGGGGNILFAEEERDLPMRVGECLQVCQKQEKEEQKSRECFGSCMQKYKYGRQKEKGRGDRNTRKQQSQSESESESNNPYVFQDHHFTARLETQLGSIRVLQKFTDRSNLFQAIHKYRVAFLEAQPHTFVMPNHWDADALFVVVNGEGTIGLINTESRQSYNLKRGDIFVVPAGINAYLINRHNNQKLVLAKILHSISVPGELQMFFAVGGDNPESSFLNAFSSQVLEAAFDTDEIEKLVGEVKQGEGIFKEATDEQIESFSGEDAGGIWPFGKRKGPYNIYNKNPSVENEYGNLHEVDSHDFADLQDMNVAFSFFNITQGSMAGPFYNTRTTMVLVVANGDGRFEMACPHLSEQSRRATPVPTYKNVNSRLQRGTVVVIPAGHPVVIEASGNQNLEVIGFGLNSDENEWFPLAGKDSVMSQWEDEAIHLTFGRPAKEVKKVTQKQKKKLFFKGPKRSGRAYA